MKRKMNGYNYNIFTNNSNYVRVSTTYAKKPVYGYAVLSEGDTFDLEKGIKLAKARCDVNVAKKRKKELSAKLKQIHDLQDFLLNEQQELTKCWFDATKEVVSTTFELEQILEEM